MPEEGVEPSSPPTKHADASQGGIHSRLRHSGLYINLKHLPSLIHLQALFARTDSMIIPS